jgi:hypothetical protein
VAVRLRLLADQLATREKGGRIAATTTVCPELIDQLANRARLETELIGHLLVGLASDENGAQRFVPAVIGLGGLSEEFAAAGVVHDRCSWEKSVGFAGQTKANRKDKTPARRRDSSTNRPKTRNLAADARILTLGICAALQRNPTDTARKKCREIAHFRLQNVSRFPRCGNRR